MSQVLDILVDSGIQLSIQRKGMQMSGNENVVTEAIEVIESLQAKVEELQATNERISRLRYEDGREYRNSLATRDDYIARLEAEIAELRA
jgi:FtsZ-binding cell division protein ZapB